MILEDENNIYFILYILLIFVRELIIVSMLSVCFGIGMFQRGYHMFTTKHIKGKLSKTKEMCGTGSL